MTEPWFGQREPRIISEIKAREKAQRERRIAMSLTNRLTAAGWKLGTAKDPHTGVWVTTPDGMTVSQYMIGERRKDADEFTRPVLETFDLLLSALVEE